jgi:hypothetical protein
VNFVTALTGFSLRTLRQNPRESIHAPIETRPENHVETRSKPDWAPAIKPLPATVFILP